MELIKNIIIYGILGAIQGFSEPIPISSSGHLVIFQSIFEKMGLMVPQILDHYSRSCIIIATILLDYSQLSLAIFENQKKETITKVILDTVFY